MKCLLKAFGPDGETLWSQDYPTIHDAMLVLETLGPMTQGVFGYYELGSDRFITMGSTSKIYGDVYRRWEDQENS